MKLREHNFQSLPVGLIGLGSIGSYVAREIMKGKVPGIKLVAAADIKTPSSDLLQELQNHSVAVVQSFEALAKFPIQLVVECANQKVVKECADFFVSKEIDLVIMSMGALVQGSFFADLAAKAEERRMSHLYPFGRSGGHRCFKGCQAGRFGRGYSHDS